PAAPLLDAAEQVTTTPIDSVAAAAIDRAEAEARPVAPPAPVVAAAPAEAPATGGSLIQIGIFSVEANARRAADTLGKAGITAAIRAEETQGKKFWSVTARGNAQTLAAIKSAGFADAYVLKR
ncbi:MAG TPA: SPOR domain-containing protein, partial [Paracoccaceae bacterium]|nr:SPOR domain-containing protein [Paracoccaceae bacterium]